MHTAPYPKRTLPLPPPSGICDRAQVELWIGPIRCVHEMIYDCMNGVEYPLRATLKFKKLSPVLKISGNGEFEFPVVCGVFVPEPEESKKIGKITEEEFFLRSEVNNFEK